MKTQNIPQAVYDILLSSNMRVKRDDCSEIFFDLYDCNIKIQFLGENNQDIQMQLCFPTLTSKRLVQFAYDACIALNQSSRPRLSVVSESDKKQHLMAVVNYTCSSEEDATNWLCGEGLNILKATRMQVFDFMMEYFSLDAENENEIEAIISDIPV